MRSSGIGSFARPVGARGLALRALQELAPRAAARPVRQRQLEQAVFHLRQLDLGTVGPIVLARVGDVGARSAAHQHVALVAQRAHDEGYVTLSPASGDRREKNASLTPAGQTYARALLEPLYALEDAVFARMGDARVQEMMDAIALFNMLFEKETEMIK